MRQTSRGLGLVRPSDLAVQGLSDVDQSCHVCNCRFKLSHSSGTGVIWFQGYCIDCTFYGGGKGIDFVTSSYLGACCVSGCTFYGMDVAIEVPNGATTGFLHINSCHATDCAKWIDNPYSATEDSTTIEVRCRTRDNTTIRTGIGTPVLVAEITTDTGGAETDYEDASTGDFRLITGAPGQKESNTLNRDIGHIQHIDAGGGGSSGGGRLIDGGLVSA